MIRPELTEGQTYVAMVTSMSQIREKIAQFKEGRITIVEAIEFIAAAADYHGRCKECKSTTYHKIDCGKK